MNPQKIWQNGIRLLEKGDYQAATEQFDKACALDPVAQAPYLESATPLQWSERGLSFLRLNFPDQAMVCFAKAAQVEDADLHTQSVSSVLVVCQALEEMGSLEAAATLLERALTLSQGQSTVRRRLERVLMKLLQQESGRHALSVGERLKSLLPKDDARRGIVYCYQGHAYRRGGQPELALEAYKTAMKRGAPGAERSRRELILELNRPELYDEMNGSELVHLILWDMFQLPLSRAERVPQELSEEELDRLLLVLLERVGAGQVVVGHRAVREELDAHPEGSDRSVDLAVGEELQARLEGLVVALLLAGLLLLSRGRPGEEQAEEQGEERSAERRRAGHGSLLQGPT